MDREHNLDLAQSVPLLVLQQLFHTLAIAFERCAGSTLIAPGSSEVWHFDGKPPPSRLDIYLTSMNSRPRECPRSGTFFRILQHSLSFFD